MGKGKYQRVVLILGLLFLAIIICGILLLQRMQWQQSERYRVMGELLINHPEMEVELIEVCEDPENEFSDRYLEAGKKLAEKYGYHQKYSKQENRELLYSLETLGCLFTVTVIITGILIYFDYKQVRYTRTEECAKEQYNEIKEHNQTLIEKLTQEEKNTKELITDISHQLKTPLSSLKMNYEIAQSEDFTFEERNTFLQQGRTQIIRLEALLDSLLNIARLETGMIQMKPASSGLKETLISAVNSVFMKAFEKKIDIVLEEFEDLHVLHDTKWTKEAVGNVLDNAIKYSNSNTTIKLKVTVMVSYVLLEIADEGIGIPVKDYPNIFKRFYRGQSERVQMTEGSGVGLYLVRKILEEQGGTVCVKQGIPCGSIFLLTLQKV